MANSLDIFTGIFLTAIGIVVVYGSIAYRLIDLILIIGILITLFGLYKLVPAFILRILDSRGSSNSNLLGQSKPKSYQTKLDFSNNKNENSGVDYIKKGAKEVNNLLQDTDNSKAVLKTPDNYYEVSEKENYESGFEEKPDYALNHSNSNAQVFSPRPKNRDAFRPLQERRNPRQVNNINQADPIYFTPNYEKPMRVTRRPKRKSENAINLNNVPNRSVEISKALANSDSSLDISLSDEIFNDDNYSISPKQMDEEVIIPVDDDYDENRFNLSKSENTAYNNLIYDEVEEEDDADFSFDYITPIHNEEDMEDYENSVGLLDDMDNVTSYRQDDYSSSDLESEDFASELSYEKASIEKVSPVADEESETADEVSQSKDSNKKDIQLRLSPEGRLIGEDLTSDDVQSEIGEVLTSDVVQSEIDDDLPSEIAVDSDIEEELKGDVSSEDVIEADDTSEDVIVEDDTSEELITADVSEEVLRKTLPRPTSVSSTNPIAKKKKEAKKELKRPIQIDPNNPESLPIPKLLNSYVICDKGILTSHEAFDEMAKHSKKSILAQVPSIKDMGRTFISKLPKLSSRIIIQEFDANDEKYVDLLSALLQRGVEIRTLPLVNSLNLVDDDSYALIISNAVDEDSMEYGAVYNDSESIENIKAIFESSWEIAKDLEL